MYIWALERLDTERIGHEEWKASLNDPLPGTVSREKARVSPKLLEEEMAMFRQAQAQS